MKTLKTLMAIAVSTVLLASCGSNANKMANHIPKNALAVIAVNAGSMLGKLEKDSMSVEQMLAASKQMHGNDINEALKQWNDLKDAGIDWQHPFFIVALQDTVMSSSGAGFAVLAALSDEGKFEAAVKAKSGKEVVSEHGYKSVPYSDGSVAWNKNMAIITGGSAKSASATALFNIKKENSIVTAKHFDEAVAKNADVMIFNTGAAINNPQAAMVLAMVPKAKEFVEGIEAISLINFEDGKATLESITYVGDKLGTLLDKYAGPEADLSLVERFPAQQLNTVAAFSFKPELIPAIIEELGISALVSMPLSQEGLTIDDFGKVFKGDFAVVVGDLKVTEKEMGKDGSKAAFNDPSANLVVAARIGDRAIFDKLLGKAVEKGILKREGDMIVAAVEDADMKGLTMGIAGDLLVISNNKATWDAYAAGTKTKLNDQVSKTFAGQSAAVFVDINSILKAIPDSAMHSNAQGQAMFMEAKNIFQSADMYMANYKNGKLTGGGQLLVTPGKNSLSRLANFAMTAASATETKDTAMSH